MFVLVVRFDLPDAAAAEAFDGLVRAAVPDILASEPGTLTYVPHAVLDEPLARVFYEVYRDKAAHAAHEDRPATAAFLARVRELQPVIRVEAMTPR
ncbi:Quinol monooxygenase YgiN [Nakamurella panacisegetis]|uniref:Quinol monooxygenase YgiN n=1 Tax=Nakamurella panacisegetis TaxID=1090615 RepID=A0A1H0R7Z3_9ACTN|nr:antibiotic biosynthesis monooxygenase [Nakamurella panacisegetis]SDP25617.1 Quinol monooxygenase YgiN [Nakamurella panacisegetis]